MTRVSFTPAPSLVGRPLTIMRAARTSPASAGGMKGVLTGARLTMAMSPCLSPILENGTAQRDFNVSVA
jgi:hypothetical protein